MQNSQSQLWSGECCGGAGRSAASACPAQCRTAVALCLKEYQSTQDGGKALPRQVLETGGAASKGAGAGAGGWGGCTYGNDTSPVIGGSSFTLAQSPPAAHIHLPFTFAWTVSAPVPSSLRALALLGFPIHALCSSATWEASAVGAFSCFRSFACFLFVFPGDSLFPFFSFFFVCASFLIFSLVFIRLSNPCLFGISCLFHFYLYFTFRLL